MDATDEKILEMIKGNARMSYQEIGKELGMSRVAAMKRIRKLEAEGIIRGYNTCIYRDDEITLLVDIETRPESFDKVLKYVTTRTAFVRQIFRTSKANSFHMVAVSDSVDNLEYLLKMIDKKCGDDIRKMSSRTVREVIKDVYGGVGYERKDSKDSQ